MKQRDSEHAALVGRLRAEADYDSYEALDEDEAREGDDVYIGKSSMASSGGKSVGFRVARSLGW